MDKASEMRIEAALRRAGMRALWLGKRLGVPVVVYRDGKIVDAAKTDPEPTEEQMRRPERSESANRGNGESARGRMYDGKG